MKSNTENKLFREADYGGGGTGKLSAKKFLENKFLELAKDTVTKIDLDWYAAAMEEYAKQQAGELIAEITRLQEKYDENGYDCPPLIKLLRMEQHIDMGFEIYAKLLKEKQPAKAPLDVNHPNGKDYGPVYRMHEAIRQISHKDSALGQQLHELFCDVMEPKAPEAGVSDGVSLIAAKRQLQITKHGRTQELDALNNKNQLAHAACRLLLDTPYDEEINGIGAYVFAQLPPEGWNKDWWQHMIEEPYLERLVNSGSLIAAEIDRIIPSSLKQPTKGDIKNKASISEGSARDERSTSSDQLNLGCDTIAGEGNKDTKNPEQPAQQAPDSGEILQKLIDINEIAGTCNLSSHHQMANAIREIVEISDELRASLSSPTQK